MKNASMEERFWEKVRKTSRCWLWTGQRPNGYGRLDTYAPKRANYSAHRMSWTIHKGEIPSGLHVLHRCDNPACVNPKHLFLGDQKANNADKIAKKRHVRGSGFPHSKLTDKSVASIKAQYQKGGITQTSLAGKYGVSRSQISGIVLGKTWRHVA